MWARASRPKGRGYSLVTVMGNSTHRELKQLQVSGPPEHWVVSGYEEGVALALIQYSELRVPTSLLTQTLRTLQNQRPFARPQLLARRDRLAERSFWVAFAIFERRLAQRLYEPYFPPCITCAVQTASWCDRCRGPICSACDEDTHIRCLRCVGEEAPSDTAAGEVRILYTEP